MPLSSVMRAKVGLRKSKTIKREKQNAPKNAMAREVQVADAKMTYPKKR